MGLAIIIFFLFLFLSDLRGGRRLLTVQYSLPGIPVAKHGPIDLRTSMDGKYKEIAEVILTIHLNLITFRKQIHVINYSDISRLVYTFSVLVLVLMLKPPETME